MPYGQTGKKVWRWRGKGARGSRVCGAPSRGATTAEEPDEAVEKVEGEGERNPRD